MRNHRRAWLAILMALALAAFAWMVFVPRDSEPFYQGKPLHEWLALYSIGYFGSNPADEAIRHIGTNAIPTLLEMFQEKDSPLKLKWIALLQKQHFIHPPQPAYLRNNQAVRAFEALGGTASNAVPTLVQVYRMKISDSLQMQTLNALGGIGPAVLPAATPVLLDGLTNSDFRLRTDAAIAIGQIHGQPEVFVPALINALKDTHASVRPNAVLALARYGPAAKSAAPALMPFLNDTDPDIRADAAYVLKAIDPVAAANAGIK